MRAVQLRLRHWPIAVWARWVRLLFLACCRHLWSWFAHHSFYLPRVPRIHLRAVLWPHQHGSIAESWRLQPSTTALNHCRRQDGYNICGHRNITPMTMGFLHKTCSSTEFLVSQTEECAADSVICPRAETTFALWRVESGNRQNSLYLSSPRT